MIYLNSICGLICYVGNVTEMNNSNVKAVLISKSMISKDIFTFYIFECLAYDVTAHGALRAIAILTLLPLIGAACHRDIPNQS